MTKQTSYYLGMFVTIALSTWGAWAYCCGLNSGNNSGEQHSFTIYTPEKSVLFSHKDNFNFSTSQFTISPPVSIHIDQGIDSLRYYLNNPDHKDEFVQITGYYFATERNTSALENLGLARANTVKNYLVNKGIPAQRIQTNAAINTSAVEDESLILGPISYSVLVRDNTAQKEAARLARIKQNSIDNPLVLQFESAEVEIDLSALQQEKVNQIRNYLDNVPEARLEITGYADNTGSRLTNIALGLNRANFAKAYFVKSGIPATKIDTYSKGAENPVASNETLEGRAQNRRCVVILN